MTSCHPPRTRRSGLIAAATLGGSLAGDATFCPESGKSGQGTSFRSYNHPDRYVRHYNGAVYIASDGGPNARDTATLWPDDVTWAVSPPWS